MTKEEVDQRIAELESELRSMRLSLKAMEFHISHLRVAADAACGGIRLVHVRNSDEALPV